MRIEIIIVYYVLTDYVRRFSINHWWVGKFPITYTAQECAEVYCELVGWKLLHLCKEGGDIEGYTISVEMPDDEDLTRTITHNYYDVAELKGTL